MFTYIRTKLNCSPGLRYVQPVEVSNVCGSNWYTSQLLGSIQFPPEHSDVSWQSRTHSIFDLTLSKTWFGFSVEQTVSSEKFVRCALYTSSCIVPSPWPTLIRYNTIARKTTKLFLTKHGTALIASHSIVTKLWNLNGTSIYVTTRCRCRSILHWSDDTGYRSYHTINIGAGRLENTWRQRFFSNSGWRCNWCELTLPRPR